MKEADQNTPTIEKVYETFSQLFFSAHQLTSLQSSIDNSSNVEGHGALLIKESKLKYDFASSPLLGHCHPLELKDKAYQTHQIGNETTLSMEEFESILLSFLPQDFKFVYLISSEEKKKLNFEIVELESNFKKAKEKISDLVSQEKNICLFENEFFGRFPSCFANSFLRVEKSIDAILIHEPFQNMILFSKTELEISETKLSALDSQIARLLGKTNLYGSTGRVKKIADLISNKFQEIDGVNAWGSGLVLAVQTSKYSASKFQKILSEMGILSSVIQDQESQNEMLQFLFPLNMSDIQIEEFITIIKQVMK